MTKEEFLAAAGARYDKLKALNLITDFYDYEVEFVNIWRDLGQEVMEKNIGTVSADKRKKNLTTLGYITINNCHSFSKGKNGFQISPRMQELMVFAGQTDCYENCNEVIEKYLSLEVSSSQVHRVTNLYGKEVGKSLNEHPTLTPARKGEVLYVEADGSMILTREESWKEVKLGRIFKASDCIHAAGKQGWISNSQYVAHLGDHKTFSKQMENLIDSYKHTDMQIVFITDGAPWLRNWIEDAYSTSTSILDFYHASEYLHSFCREHFEEKAEEKSWVTVQKKLLLESRVLDVIANVKALKSTKKEAEKLINYYSANIDRMDYKKYQGIGCGIFGSGAIESAHRKVIQKRMKQSGQRWSKEGAQHMLNLRVVKSNHQWGKIVDLTKKEFKKAA